MRRFIELIYRMVPPGQMTIVLVGVILYLTLAPDPLGAEDIPAFPGADKVVHAIMFGTLSLIIALDRFMIGRNDKAIVLIIIAVMVSIAGGIIEILQQASAIGRSGDIWDFAADTAGAFLGVWAFTWVRKDLHRSRA
ncbi:MAG: VanZ family protein [Lachnoclostridium sp.]|nr:VanZ family protein [Lachnoclostridium sp.]